MMTDEEVAANTAEFRGVWDLLRPVYDQVDVLEAQLRETEFVQRMERELGRRLRATLKFEYVEVQHGH